MKARHVKMARSAYRAMKRAMGRLGVERARVAGKAASPEEFTREYVRGYVAGLAAGMLEFKHALGWIAEARP